MCLVTVLPVAGSVPSDETEALKAEITKAVEKVQEAGKELQGSRAQLVLFKYNSQRMDHFHLSLTAVLSNSNTFKIWTKKKIFFQM